MSSRSYDDAITCLNSLQSNPAEVKQGNRPPAIRGPRKLQLVREYLARIGYSVSHILFSLLHEATILARGLEQT
jgi:hypothetical protein